MLERRGRGSALTICLPECGESSKGATARAWPGDAHSYSPPSRPACLLTIAAATSSRLTPTYPIPTPTCWPAHFPDDAQRMLLTFARAPYTVGAELSARHPADRLWRPIRCRLRLSQMSRPPPAPCRRVGRAHAKWGGAVCTRLGCKQHVYVRARSRCTRSAQCRGRVSADWGGGTEEYQSAPTV